VPNFDGTGFMTVQQAKAAGLDKKLQPGQTSNAGEGDSVNFGPNSKDFGALAPIAAFARDQTALAGKSAFLATKRDLDAAGITGGQRAQILATQQLQRRLNTRSAEMGPLQAFAGQLPQLATVGLGGTGTISGSASAAAQAGGVIAQGEATNINAAASLGSALLSRNNEG